MKVLDVLNVGQGDSIIIHPEKGCKYESHYIIVDLGPGNYDITKHLPISKKNNIHIIITHHDADHLNGIRFFSDMMDQVEDIFVPLYQNEITIIAKSLLNLQGIREAENCEDFIRVLEDVVSNQVYLREITGPRHKGPKLRYAYENRTMCDHICFLNPPGRIEVYDWIGEAEQKDLENLFMTCFEDGYAQSLCDYLFEEESPDYRDMGNGYFEELDTPISELLLQDSEQNVMKREFDYNGKLGKSYIVNFFFNHYDEIKAFNLHPTREMMRPLYDEFIKCTHDACIVLYAEFNKSSYLLTGDASKKVFNRLIKSNVPIEAEYLKIPHHGSKENMDEDILDKICPNVAIISHNNRRFGNAKDTHPNTEILNMLQERGTRILITNDVIKKGITVMKKENHSSDENVNIF